MPVIDQASMMAVQPELTSGETVVWAGQPNTRVIFHREDAGLIPFSLLWGGFSIFWEAGVSGLWGDHHGQGLSFMVVWGIPFVLIGQYLIWGRFFFAAWLKRRTYYAVTNRRVITIQNAWSRQTASSYIESLPTLNKESGSKGTGTLRFAQPQSVRSNRQGFGSWNSLSVGPAFVDIDDVDGVYRLVDDLREKARSNKPTS
jgi:hypothetical protein